MLGKGLESLIPKKSDGYSGRPPSSNSPPSGKADEPRPASPLMSPKRPTESIFQIEVEKIKPNPYQPRRDFKNEELAELAVSVREFGIIQPLVVTKVEKETPSGTEVEYQLVAGERRLMAAKLIGLSKVPVVIKRLDFHRAKLEIALVENVQRADLNPIEAARAYARLQEEFGLTQREIAAKIGKSRETVGNAMRLLSLPTSIREALSGGKINESQARILLAASDAAKQQVLFDRFLQGGSALRKGAAAPKSSDPESAYWEKRLEERLGAPVKVLRRGPGGRVVLQFHSEEEWRGILEKLIGPEEV